MKIALTRLVLSLVTVCALAVTASAQVTTGSLNGKVQNETAGRRVRRERHRDPPPVGHDLRNDVARGWPVRHPQHARRRPVLGDGGLHRHRRRGVRARDRRERRDQPRRRHRPQHRRQADRGHRNGHGDGGIERGVQLGAHRRGHRGQPRDAGDAADGVRPHLGLHAPDAADLGHQLVRRRRQPHEQHDGQRRGLQQLVRPRRPARRPHRRLADFDGSHRAGAGQHRAL